MSKNKSKQKQKKEEQVVLGFVGEIIASKNDNLDPYCTKVGGSPAFLHEAPPTTLLTCTICGSTMDYLLQAYSPLYDVCPSHERVIHLFVCSRRGCSSNNGGWIALRSHIEVPVDNIEMVEPHNDHDDTINANNWGINTNIANDDEANENDDWGMGNEWNIEENLDLDNMIDNNNNSFQDNHNQKKKKKKKKKKKEKAVKDEVVIDDKGSFEAHYMFVEKEPSKEEAEVSVADDIQLNSLHVSDGSEGEEWHEEYEDEDNRHLVKFMKRISRSPEQCLRYCFGGTPLLMIKDDEIAQKIPVCSYCGSKRVFEMQVLSALLYFLKHTQQNKSSDRQSESNNQTKLDFGTVVVYTCSQSCVDSKRNYFQEFVYIQPSI